MARGKWLSDEERAKIIQLHRDGMSTTEIATRLQRGLKSIKRVVEGTKDRCTSPQLNTQAHGIHSNTKTGTHGVSCLPAALGRQGTLSAPSQVRRAASNTGNYAHSTSSEETATNSQGTVSTDIRLHVTPAQLLFQRQADQVSAAPRTKYPPNGSQLVDPLQVVQRMTYAQQSRLNEVGCDLSRLVNIIPDDEDDVNAGSLLAQRHQEVVHLNKRLKRNEVLHNRPAPTSASIASEDTATRIQTMTNGNIRFEDAMRELGIAIQAMTPTGRTNYRERMVQLFIRFQADIRLVQLEKDP